MPNTSLTTSLSPYDSETDSSEIWLNMEQEDVPIENNFASEGDIINMLSYASTGQSATTYVQRSCSYVTVTADSVIVRMGFYVWPSSLDLQYNLTADTGEISPGVLQKLHRSFDVVVDGTNSVMLEFLFEGKGVPSMPFFLLNGQSDKSVTSKIEGAVFSTTETGYCVYRTRGQSQGYYHIVTMTLPKTEAEKITSFSNTVVAEYVQADGSIAAETLSLDIPQCVQDALEACTDGALSYEKNVCGDGECGGDNPRLDVYFNSCDGESILEEHWVENV